MSDEEHSDNEFYNPEMQETAERNGGILTKLKQAEILVWKVSPGCTDFRKKKLPRPFGFTVKYQNLCLAVYI